MNGTTSQSIGQIQSFTMTWTGFSSNPTATCQYSRTGKLCYISIARSANGVSNAAATTVTLPFDADSVDEQVIPFQVTSNGTTQAGYLRTRTGTNIADVLLADGTNPGAANAKSIQGNGWYITT